MGFEEVMQTPRILSTKKLQPNQKQFLLNANLAVIEADFIAVNSIRFTLENIKDNLIFTSANAVKAVANHQDVQDIRRKPCFCVGEKTAAMLDESGFTVIEIADEAAMLAPIIAAKYASERFTFFSGNLRMDTLPEMLEKSGIDFNETGVYETILTPRKIETPVDGILFFSPSGVASFLKENNIENEMCFCIGHTTAKALEAKNKVIANRPSVENVIIQCINHYKKA